MPSRKAKRARVRTRTCNDNQQVEDELQLRSNHSDGDEIQVIQRKRVRGPTFMPKVWTISDENRITVSINEHGQPIDKKTTSTLTHFMGSLARSGKYCPLHKPWPKVGSAKKFFLLDVLNDKFDLPMGCDDWILKSFGKKVRNWRARVKKDYYDPSLSYREQINLKPKRVRPGQWKKLVKTWNKENSKESLGGREPTRVELFRACFSTDGTAKNVEAANAIDKMEELSSQLSEGETDEPGPQDVYSKVMGKGNNGPADLYGLGVRASDVWGVVLSRSARRSSENASLGTNVVNEPQPLRVGAEVYIKSIFNSTEIVAKGRIKSLDPNEIVGGEELGPNWCEVNVQVPIKRDEHLVRRYGLFVTIYDAIGATIAWPCPFVSVVREDDA
ncbi:eukaryotic translation initiation factor 5B-like protein [Tanacetum coccineum]